MNRWGWFFGAILVAVALFLLADAWIDFPNPGLIAPSVDIDTAMKLHAGQFGGWVLLYILIVAALAAGLVFWSFYLQLFHVGMRRRAWAGRLGLCYVLALIGGFWLVYRAINWALHQRETSVLRQALDNPDAAKQISWSGGVFPIGWEWGIRVDMLGVCLVGVVLGYLIYVMTRKSLVL